MFLDNKYTKWYFDIIYKADDMRIKGKTERHHILPKSICPEYANFSKCPWNSVHLTYKEHFICHWLLTKMVASQYQYEKMIYALNGMLHLENEYQQRYRVTGKIYASLREKFALVHSSRMTADNPMTRPDVKATHNEAIKKRGATTGNTGNTASEETKRKMRAKRAKQVITEETKEKLKIINMNRDYDPGNTGKVSWYNPVTRIRKYFDVGIVPSSDWVKGVVPLAKVTCPHCGKHGNRAPMSRWHFDNCKEKNK